METTDYKNFWNQIIQKIHQMEQLDPHKVLVSKPQLYKRFERLPTVPEKEIIAFEREHQLTLPENYRSYLQYFGAGGVGPGYNSSIFSFYSESFRDNLLLASYPSKIEAIKGCNSDIEDGKHPIQDLHGLLKLDRGMGDYFLVVNGAEHGLVWFWNYEDMICNCDQFDQWYDEWVNRTIELLKNYHAFHSINGSMSFEQIKKTMKVPYTVTPMDGENEPYHRINFENTWAYIVVEPDYDLNKENFKIIKIKKPTHI